MSAFVCMTRRDHDLLRRFAGGRWRHGKLLMVNYHIDEAGFDDMGIDIGFEARIEAMVLGAGSAAAVFALASLFGLSALAFGLGCGFGLRRAYWVRRRSRPKSLVQPVPHGHSEEEG